MNRWIFVLCTALALAGVAKGSSVQVIIFAIPALYALLDLYPPKGDRNG